MGLPEGKGLDIEKVSQNRLNAIKISSNLT